MELERGSHSMKCITPTVHASSIKSAPDAATAAKGKAAIAEHHLLYAGCAKLVNCMTELAYHMNFSCAFAASLSGGCCLSRAAAS